MNTTYDGLSRGLTVALLVMVLASTPMTAMGYGSSSSISSSVAESGGTGDFTFKETDNYLGCISFAGVSDSLCDSHISDQLEVSTTSIPTSEAGKMKLKVDASVESGFNDEYTVEARADDGEWAQSLLPESGEPTSLSVENSYRRGSIQYPTVYVQVIDDSTGDVVALNSHVLSSPITIPSGDESWFDEELEVGNGDGNGPSKGITVIGDDQREVLKPGYSTVSRFNDNDGTHEPFEDVSLPPVRYDRAGVQVSGPEGDVLHFENLREDSGWPAILRHNDGDMNLGTSVYGVPSAEYQKMRIDYGLQTESANQDVQINLVNSYGEVIDSSVKDSSSRRLEQTTGQSESYFADRSQYENALYEDNLNTNSIEFSLTSTEKEYIADNNDIYVTYSTDDRAYLLLYRTPLISQSVQDQTNDNFVPDLTHFEEEFNTNPGEDNVATFDATYRVDGELNDKYDSFDREPNEDLDIQITVNNDGDSRIERNVGIYSMSENNVSLYGSDAEAKTIDKRTVGVEPRSSKTFTVSYDYEDHEYGNHNLSVLDTTDANNPIHIARERDDKNISKAYVLQPATFEVRNVITPNSWLRNDNFNTTVIVQNVGDLNGTGVINGEFQDWAGSEDIPDTRGGNVRENAPGSYANVTFDSQNHQYSPSYPERPERGDDSKRPNSPFGSELTYSDNRPHQDDNRAVDNRSIFDATTSHPFATPNERLYESLNDTNESDTVRIYNLEIVTLKVEGDRDNDDSWYASGYSYVNNESSPYWSAWKPATDYDIFEDPYEKMPTIDNGKFLYPPYQEGISGENPMAVTVEVSNNGQTEIGDARVEIRTDKIGFDGANGGVIGTSGRSNIDKFSSEMLEVPVVIRNDATNGGTHTLSAEVREEDDYIQRVDVRPNQDNVESDQFETQVDIELWADFMHTDTSAHDLTVHERCSGHNPEDDAGQSVTCDSEDVETFGFDQFHQNFGGEAGTLTVDAFIETWEDPSSHSHYEDFGYVSDPNDYTTNYWNQQEQTISPAENKEYTADDLKFKEPGVYVIKSEPHRENHENDELDQYNQTDIVPDEEWVQFKILDITNPEPHAEISDTTYPCKSGICDSSAGNWSVWEGGYAEFDNDSVDNVVVDTIDWSGVSYNGGYRDCHGQTNGGCYSNDGYDSSQIEDKIVHRFDSDGVEDITLTARDHPEYGEGASVEGTGTPNEEDQTWPLSVKEDTNAPDVSVIDDYHQNPDNSPDSSTVWERNSDTGYEGIGVCFTASSSDDEIGIEADEWSGVSGSPNEDTRCRTWGSDGDRTITYDAWDFAGNDETDTKTVSVEEDTTDPTISSMSGSRSSMWVDKDHYSSSVSWSVNADDDETGLINCDDGGAYDWSGDTNGADSSCSSSFSTDYHSASESGTEFQVDVDVMDYHGNLDTESDTIVQYEDKTDPSISGETSDSGSGSGGTTVCVSPDYEDHGPSGGIGIHSDSGTVCHTYNYEAPGNIAPNPDPECEETETTSASETDSKTFSGTLYAEDEHGNRETTSYSIEISDKDYDHKTETNDEECPPPEDDGGDSGGCSGGMCPTSSEFTEDYAGEGSLLMTLAGREAELLDVEMEAFDQHTPVNNQL